MFKILDDLKIIGLNCVFLYTRKKNLPLGKMLSNITRNGSVKKVPTFKVK